MSVPASASSYKYAIRDLPKYLQDAISSLPRTSEQIPPSQSPSDIRSIEALDLGDIRVLPSRQSQYVHLLLKRHHVTQKFADQLNCLDLILERAQIHEALGYPELAYADANFVYTVLGCLDDSDASEPVPELNSDPGYEEIEPWWDRYRSLLILYRCATVLGCTGQAAQWHPLLEGALCQLRERAEVPSWQTDAGRLEEDLEDYFVLYEDSRYHRPRQNSSAYFGWCQRLLYPWNEHEPDRLSVNVLRDINHKLEKAAPCLEAKVSSLPILNGPSTTVQLVDKNSGTHELTAGQCLQLGLYARQNIAPGTVILRERSILTAIKLHGEALCDACAADLETTKQIWSCPACDIPFCSEECYQLAMKGYHRPSTTTMDADSEANSDGDNEHCNVPDAGQSDSDDDYPPASSPFCPGKSGNDDIHTLGRAESSETPEWDLYFLLVSRCIQMAETQSKHPLDLFETKYLWGDFNLTSAPTNLPTHTGPRTLPYSVRHHVDLPLQFFEVLMHSLPHCKPYNKEWLEKYDWWIIQTLYAKFRGVADAQQSTWSGKPEIASVHALWCLANHSCDPNVEWESSGVRLFTVRDERVGQRPDEQEKQKSQETWEGIREGEQIWSHYTDVDEKDFRVRRDRLREVLGGDCLCDRCLWEENATKVDGGSD